MPPRVSTWTELASIVIAISFVLFLLFGANWVG
jgi:hypothetical protein